MDTVGSRANVVVDPTGSEGAAPSERPMRADARRNYETIVASAREVFDEEGTGASMEAVAKRAGVGVGTLYRHFPQRIDLVEAVYRRDVDQLVGTAESAVDEATPWAAVEIFLHAFVQYALRKRVLLNELHEAFAKNPEFKSDTRERINGAMSLVIERAQAAGQARPDVTGEDLMQLVGPMCMSALISPEQGERLLHLLLDGIRLPAR